MSLYDSVNALLASGSETWDSLLAKSKSKAPDAETDPQKYETDATRFAEAMKASRAALDAARPFRDQSTENAARWNRLNFQYFQLLEKFKQANVKATGFPPALIIAGVVFVSSAAIAWAVAMAPYAEGHRVQSQAFLEEVRARDAASREGRTLAPGTKLPDGPGIEIDWKMIVPVIGIGGLIAWFALKR